MDTDDKPGPWGSKKRPYDPRDDGFDRDGFKPWDRRASLIIGAVGLALALLGGWLGGGK